MMNNSDIQPIDKQIEFIKENYSRFYCDLLKFDMFKRSKAKKAPLIPNYYLKDGKKYMIVNHQRMECNCSDISGLIQLYLKDELKVDSKVIYGKYVDYMICVLHQKKCPCPVQGCNYKPFGILKKSFMMKCARGIIGDESQIGKEPEPPYIYNPNRRVEPFFPLFKIGGIMTRIPIDMKTRTVTLMGVPIKLKI